eukprot:1600493-Rhodomonas_salina.1
MSCRAGHGAGTSGRYGHCRAYRPIIHKSFREKRLGSVLGTIGGFHHDLGPAEQQARPRRSSGSTSKPRLL